MLNICLEFYSEIGMRIHRVSNQFYYLTPNAIEQSEKENWIKKKQATK